MGVDLVLSSGFLAFAEQSGFLAAVEDVGLPVDGLCGTSSGALAGSLWAAGMSAQEIYEELCAHRPMGWLRPSLTPWRGAFRLDRVRDHLEGRIPARFEDLPMPFGAGVAEGSEAHLLTAGALVPAVAASCAVPYLFEPVTIDGRTFLDGGAVDRTALSAWRAARPGQAVVLHLLEASLGAAADAPELAAEVVCHSPRSGAQLWSLGDHRARFQRTRAACRVALERAVRDGALQAV